jgi:hypothetical protein
MKRALDMTVQRSGVELGEDEDPVDVGVDAIADRNIDQTVFAGEWHGGFAAFLREWGQAGAAATAHNHCKHTLLGREIRHGGRLF